MRYYPINLDLKERVVVVVGGGRVAARKTLRLVAAGARVTLVAPRIHETLLDLVAKGALRHVGRSYRPGDLAGALLVFAATDDPQVNLAVADEARKAKILVD